MAIAFSTLTSNGQQNASTTYTTASISPAAGSVLLVSVVTFENTATQPDITSISGAGLTWSEVTFGNHDTAGTDRGTTFLWLGKGTPSTGALTITFAASVSRASWVVTEVTGANTTTPIVQTAASVVNAGGTSATLSAFADATNNAAFVAVGTQESGTTDGFTPEAGYTQGGVWHGASFYHNYTAYKIGQDTSPSGTWTSSRSALIGAEIAAASGPAPPNSGAATGGYDLTGTAAGTRASRGSATGAYDLAGSATGNAPASSGSASGTIAWAGSATGSRSPVGAATGTYAWSGSSVGITPRRGSASGTHVWSGTAAGSMPTRTGEAVGSWSFAGSAAGVKPQRGTALGGFHYRGTARGEGIDPTYPFQTPTYQRVLEAPLLTKRPRLALTESVSVVRINGTLQAHKSPSQELLVAAGVEGVDWFLGGREYQVSLETLQELQLAGF